MTALPAELALTPAALAPGSGAAGTADAPDELAVPRAEEAGGGIAPPLAVAFAFGAAGAWSGDASGTAGTADAPDELAAPLATLALAFAFARRRRGPGFEAARLWTADSCHFRTRPRRRASFNSGNSARSSGSMSSKAASRRGSSTSSVVAGVAPCAPSSGVAPSAVKRLSRVKPPSTPSLSAKRRRSSKDKSLERRRAFWIKGPGSPTWRKKRPSRSRAGAHGTTNQFSGSVMWSQTTAEVSNLVSNPSNRSGPAVTSLKGQHKAPQEAWPNEAKASPLAPRCTTRPRANNRLSNAEDNGAWRRSLCSQCHAAVERREASSDKVNQVCVPKTFDHRADILCFHA